MSNTRLHSKARGHVAAIVATILSVALALFLFANRQYVVDQISNWQYQPTSEIVSFADKTGMNTTGKFYFYASQPSLESTQDFNDKCGRKEQSTAILGCYTGRNIYIYNVTNAQLDGIREVTAAHEMLHAAYDRMSDDERKTVDTLLEAEYGKLKDDKDFADRMAFYARTEPGERDNELHSVIGTEVGSLSSELEAHYAKYFSDRSKVVALHDKYAAVFSDLQTRGEQLSSQLTSLGNTIEGESANYNKSVLQLNNDIQAFNSKASGGGFSSDNEFQAARSDLVARAAQLDAERSAINDKVTQYNTLRSELATIASQSDALNRSIDSTLAPAPSV
jgi:hypothetical protein